MSVLKKEHHGVLIIVFKTAKILDETEIEQIGNDLRAAAEEAKGQKLLLNFSGVTFMSSAMLGRLVYLKKKCDADSTTLKLASISDNVMDVFKITKLNKVFKIYKDEQHALDAFEGKGGGLFGLGAG